MNTTSKQETSLERLKALMRVVAAERGNSAGTQEFLLGWLYGLADAGAVSEDTVFHAQQFIANGLPARPADGSVKLYEYPNEHMCRVEGKSLYQLENELLAGGPFPDSRATRIHQLSQNKDHDLHIVAKHYTLLSRARLASAKFG